MSVLDDESVFMLIKSDSRVHYEKTWFNFKAFFPENEFSDRMPSEAEIMNYFQHLREVKKYASTTVWTTYSKLNSVCKAKYSKALQEYPRVTTLLKSYDTDVKRKAEIFDGEELDSFINNADYNSPYWLVRKAIVIVALFGGLRQIETINLQLEKFVIADEGLYVVHQRAKQRSDKKETKFLIPKTSGADRIDYARYYFST